MPRKPAPRSSAEIAREIERLKEQHAKLRAAENTRRGEVMGQLLDGPHGEAIRQIMNPIIKGDDDRPLFGLDVEEDPPGRQPPAAKAAASSE